jgi:DNA-binding protein WhiA
MGCKLKSNLIISNRQLVLEFVMSSLSLARRIVFLFRKVYQLNLEFLVKEQRKLDFKNLNYLTAEERVKEILEDLGIIDQDFNFIEGIRLYMIRIKTAFTRMFIARGSVNDPAKSHYHLEFLLMNALNALCKSLLLSSTFHQKWYQEPKVKSFTLKKVKLLGIF